MSKIFLDTNILVYAFDPDTPKKRDISRQILRKLNESRVGVVSTQVIQEFFSIATKKLRIAPLLAKNILSDFENLEIVVIDFEIIKDAIDCSILNQISFWDALIVTAAESAKCEKVLTEDMNHHQIIRGVRIENPYLES
ncbi:MAG: PIN domain-containing protein [Chlamydiae bacterium]|nr:PIN domain-containing protein [Chlamydiota bacterium]MBI3276343.1 PIN domain-containing protein [Chlamydiota bacterium]